MSFPNVSEAFAGGWMSQVTLTLLRRAIDDFEATETTIKDVTVNGVLQPLPPQRLIVKPEGDRQWKWWSFWTKTALQPNDLLVDSSGSTFRVMSRANWSNGGYLEYELTEGVPNAQ